MADEHSGDHIEQHGLRAGRDVIGRMANYHIYPNRRADESLAQDLAGVVAVRSREEEEHWRIGDPVPLPVSWCEAERDLFDDWVNIHRHQEQHDPVPLSGQFTAIRETFEATGSQRLVVLGRAGAGKTVLAHRLILDLLEARGDRGPVPVLFSLNDWDPTIRLRKWMIDRLVRDFPFLANRGFDSTGTRGAEILVNGDWILPVLDGFDELPERHHPSALREISQVQLPLLLTSHPDKYAQAARATQAVGRAAAIEIDDLTVAEAEQYLCRSTPPSRVADWEAVFEQLRTAPKQSASKNLKAVLTTPLMIMLARVHYEQPDRPAPGELLDRFPTSTDLQQHLLDSYVETLYDPRRPVQPSSSARPAWSPDQVRHWLSYLAARLHACGTHDFTWWQLPALLPSRTHFLATTTIAVVVFGAAAGLGYGLVFGLTLRIAVGLAVGLVLMVAVRFAFWSEVEAPDEEGCDRRRAVHEPERLRPYLRRRSRPQRSSRRLRLNKAASECTNGLGFGLVVGASFGLVGGLGFGLAAGLVLGAVIAGVNVAVSILGEGLDPHDSDPWHLLFTDRRVTLIRAISAGLTIASFMVAYGPHLASGTNDLATAIGILCPVVVVLLRLAQSAWGNWIILARVWLPLTGRLPWRPQRFLEDAHARGMLRRAGAAYQFRHAQLRDHLARSDH